MSTNSPQPSAKRRKSEVVRKDALDIARELLIADGPRAITLKAIGGRLGMTHANLIHHFGSAERFQAQLRVSMIEDITRKAAAQVSAAPDGGSSAQTAAIVDQVFDAYAKGGLGMLMAWSVLTGGPREDGLADTTADLVAVVERTLDGSQARETARQMVSLVTLLAFADSLIGKSLAETIGMKPSATRALTTRLLERLAEAP